MIQYPSTSVHACADAESEISRLLDRIIALVEDCPHAEAILHRTTQSFCEGDDEEEPEQTVVKVEANGASYLLIRCRTGCGRTTLSPREQEIVRLVSNGHPNKTIARKLAISQHTVNTHLRRIFDKLGVNSRAEMVAYALQTGLMASPQHYNWNRATAVRSA
jgi:two-component system nitrate/nitrite response regulator NarL